MISCLGVEGLRILRWDASEAYTTKSVASEQHWTGALSRVEQDQDPMCQWWDEGHC